MKIAIVCFTGHGCVLAQHLMIELHKQKHNCIAFAKMKSPIPAEANEIEALTIPLSEWTKERFADQDALVFIGAAGIAVRSIAPYVKSKKTDPAVIVLDEQGLHAISLLSGHIGGANALTRRIADISGAEPVITTATDLNGKFAVDSFAAKRGLVIENMGFAKEIASLLVSGKRVGMCSDFPVLGEIPEELCIASPVEFDPTAADTIGSSDGPVSVTQIGETNVGFYITVQKKERFAHTLYLIPKAVTLGIGCKKDTDFKHLTKVLDQVLEEYALFQESIKQIASIDLKKEEPALLALSEGLGVPFYTYSANELEKVTCVDGFTESGFVKSITGVGNVCERAALMAAKTDRLLIRKFAFEGVTVAAAVEDFEIWMEA